MECTTTYMRGRGFSVTWGLIDMDVSIHAEITDPDDLVIELRDGSTNPGKPETFSSKRCDIL